ncbi:unnamed protein product [Symbiodinium natans]|uniref:Membrane-associated protein n=1 Tax=Symbiodinium natans TaxID=878477 RepID=A0A812TQ26_9DINO|nr:unnamed protein product [Symbiodinium natans]
MLMYNAPRMRSDCKWLVVLALAIPFLLWQCGPAKSIHEDAREQPVFEWCSPNAHPQSHAPGGHMPALRIKPPARSGLSEVLLHVFHGVKNATEQNQAYFLDDRNLLHGNEELSWNRFFQPLGGQPSSSIDFKPSWDVVRGSGQANASLNEERGAVLNSNRLLLRQVWHFQPWVRGHICQRVHALHLSRPYVGIMISHDKKRSSMKRSPNASLMAYRDALVSRTFNGLVTDVFVATSDCQVLPQLQRLAPQFNFISFCPGIEDHNPKAPQNSSNADDQHLKLLAEFVVLAAAVLCIGDHATYAYHWVAYMRPTDDFASMLDLRLYPFIQNLM